MWPIVIAAIVLGITVQDVADGLSRPPPNGSVLESGAIETERTMGIPRHVIQGPLQVEGIDWEMAERTLVLGTGGRLEVVLAEPVEIRALLVQATRRGSYEVEASLDGEHWKHVWSLPPRPDARGLVSDHLVLDAPLRARRVRISSPSTAVVSVVGALRAYAELPDGWPLAGPSEPAPASAYPWLELRSVHLVKLVVAAIAAALCVALWWLQREGGGDARRIRAVDRALVVLASIAALGWLNFLQYSGEEWERVHLSYWEATHYYLGAKYAPEIGYDGLYHCILTADAQAGLASARSTRGGVRDLATNKGLRTRFVLADAAGCTDRFSAERWASFQVDQAHLRSKFPPRVQLNILQDHGYNGTPVWSLVGRAVGALGDLDDLRLRVAFAIDPILIVLSFVLIARTFGARALCLSLVLFGTGFAFGNWFTAGAMMRFGWFATAVGGVCALARRRWALAGALLAASTLLRLFPVFLIGGVLLGALVRMVRERRVVPDAPTVRFAAGAAAAALVLVLLSIPAGGGVDIWRGFVNNTVKHTGTSGAQNLGFDALTLPLYRDPAAAPLDFRTSDHRRARVQGSTTHMLVRVIVGLVSFGLVAWAVRREPPWVCALLGLAWMGFVLDITNYYWAGAVLFAPLCLRARVLLLPYALLLFVWSVVGVAFDYERIAMYGWSSAALLVFAGSALSAFAFAASPVEEGERA